MSWRIAKSLETLRNEVNAAYPNRSKASDGVIGDTAHASTPSDHNPNAAGVVCAFDLTHDPANGLDAHALADRLITNRNPNLKYIISNSRIAGEWSGWKWQSYGGSNPHSKHIHISVGRGSDGSSTSPYDGTEPWNLKKENRMFNTHEEVDDAYLAILHRRANTIAEKANWVGKKPQDLNIAFIGSAEWKYQNHVLLKAYPELLKAYETLKAQQVPVNQLDTSAVDNAIKEASEALSAAQALKK